MKHLVVLSGPDYAHWVKEEPMSFRLSILLNKQLVNVCV